MAESPPQVNAFVLCDQAFQQAMTGKWCVIGTFGVIWAREFPVNHAPLVVFIGLSDFKGNCEVEVSIRDTEDKPVCGVKAQIPQIPMSIAEFAFNFPPVRFEKAGSYTLELVAHGSFLAARQFQVQIAPQQQPGQQTQMPPWMKPPDAPDET
ncbi:MAG: hypothetical protein CMJ83_16765 [Planctomycetes bacterium]|jgi:hypothetical protein|nr:hypothetical protein [Planctomycetota bacterium]